ncbi:hypothetical protein D9757_006853 [Collybiopsis confluens]|uniref:FAD-binding PCMH-type domain-containing protein n=1 Tax=Collybiopsis confluens TaxID=2823264 RepID=A0A8H5HPT6_9AGAR|nr:hypothetical protein D9757_006853 [Collybiopsis confluens]
MLCLHRVKKTPLPNMLDAACFKYRDGAQFLLLGDCTMKGFSDLVINSAFVWSVLASVVLASDSSLTIASATCAELQNALGPLIVQTQSGSQYSACANAVWNVFNMEVNYQPTCIVFVNSTEDVQVTMKTIYKHEADYAVRAGGHSGMSGWNTIQNGVLISFMNMSDVSYNAERDTITMEPGIHWGDALNALESFGVAAVGGRYGSVGTGLLLGGGVSFLSPGFGYAADNFVSLDVVLVNGTLVTATVDNEYADLFKALKGGGNRFGIVTRYEVKAVHVGRAEDKNWYGGFLVYPNSSAEAALNAIAHIANANDTNAVSALGILATPNSTASGGVNQAIEAFMFYKGSVESFNRSFAEFLGIPSTRSSLKALSYTDMINLFSSPNGQGQIFVNSVLAGSSPSSQESRVSRHDSKECPDSYIETFRLFNNFVASSAASGQLSNAVILITPVWESQIRYGYANGGNAISPPLNMGGFNEIELQVTIREGVTTMPTEIEQAREHYLNHIPNTPGLPLLLNQIDATQNAFKTYGGYEFLKRTYAKYDPTRFNIRHTQGPIGL